MRAELTWWWAMLHNQALNGVPFCNFGPLPPPSIIITVKASDYDLYAFDGHGRRALVHGFLPDEFKCIAGFKKGRRNAFDIKFRELLSCSDTIYHWGVLWSCSQTQIPRHVQFRIDNISTVSWQQKLSSPNSRAQVLIRLIALWELHFNLQFSAGHIAGASNHVADVGSRLTQKHHNELIFVSALCHWQQVDSKLTAFDFVGDMIVDATN
ncbi:hypothetical protein ON010_g19044 [Phytophthora cinnamomi]|nr:hypothetical protein ON010_g19044 [Phytophthora cinnamomi]